MNLDQQLLLCSLEMICCLFHMLVTHVWYVANSSIPFGPHVPYASFQAFFLEKFLIIFPTTAVLIPNKISVKGKGIQPK
jgi:hypothetical protein